MRSVIRSSNSFSNARRCARRTETPEGERSRVTPPSATVPRSSLVPNKLSCNRTRPSRSACARLAGTRNATSVARAPMSAGGLWIRSSSRRTPRRIAGDRFREEKAVSERKPLEALLDSLVDVEQPKLQVQNGLARDTESKVTWLRGARVNGTHGGLEYT